MGLLEIRAGATGVMNRVIVAIADQGRSCGLDLLTPDFNRVRP